MITYDKKTQSLVFTTKLTKEFIEGLIDISSGNTEYELSRLLVEKFRQEMKDFELSRDDIEDE